MSEIRVSKCDLCKKEYRSDVQRYWADCINPIHLNFKNHAGLQCEWKIEVCTGCGSNIRDAIASIVKDLTKVEPCPPRKRTP